MAKLKRYNISLNIEGEEVEFNAFTFDGKVVELRCMLSNMNQNFNPILQNDAIKHSVEKQIMEIEDAN